MAIKYACCSSFNADAEHLIRISHFTIEHKLDIFLSIPLEADGKVNALN